MSVVRPTAAYPPNTAVAALRTAEMFVVCAARLWVAHFCGADGAARDLERGFVTAGVDEAGLQGLCRFLDMVATATVRPLDIRRVICPHLGDDEAVLLQAVSLVQHGHLDSATMLLADWLPPSALRLALGPLRSFASSLSGAGITVLRCHGQPTGVSPASSMACSDRGVALVH